MEAYPERIPDFNELSLGQPHQVARSVVNAKLIEMAQVELGLPTVERVLVPDEMVSWHIEYPGYNPPFIDLPRGATSFRKEGDAPDPVDPNQVLSLSSLETFLVDRDENGYPLNPMGRTGLRGRGMLDKWGPTAAADPILTRNNPDTGVMEVLLIQRGDTGEWALPGGKVEENEEAWRAAGRELIEEAGVQGVELDFSTARTVYEGYVDDSRNTDNAWLKTTALHLHLDERQAEVVTIDAGSDADAAQWVAVHDGLYPKLFASHGKYLRLAVGEVVVGYAHRMHVPNELKRWDVEWSDYNPPQFTSEWVRTTGIEHGVSDPESPTEVNFSTRPSFVEGGYDVDQHDHPRNPMGRQGIAGRGDLAKWGPNQAADPVVIAVDSETGDRKILLVRRKDTGQWALPGGMVDPGERVSKTARRELWEEANIDLGEMEGEVIYEGYVDDPRNTDNSWMETTARRFVINHTPDATGGDDAIDARWFNANSVEELQMHTRRIDQELGEEPQPLYASHSQIITVALR